MTEADDETLVIGDWYKIRAKRRGVSRPFEGTLVKVNDQWIVLRLIREGRNEIGAPVASKLPFLGKRLFQNVGIGRVDETLWIPREAATVELRTPTAGQPATVQQVTLTSTPGLEERKVITTTTQAGADLLAPVGEKPPSGSPCALELAGVKEPWQTAGDVIAVTDEVVSLMVNEPTSVAEPTPVLGQIPMVGKGFVTSRIVHRPVRRQFDRADIFCVRISNLKPAAATVELLPAPPEPAAVAAPQR